MAADINMDDAPANTTVSAPAAAPATTPVGIQPGTAVPATTSSPTPASPAKPKTTPSHKAVKPRLFITVTGNQSWQIYLRDLVGPELVSSGKAEIAPYNTYTDWNNAASDYARNSGRYRQDTSPRFGQYVAPTHQISISTYCFNWKTIQVSKDVWYSVFGRRNRSFDDFPAAACMTTLTVGLKAQVYNLTTGMMEWTCSGKAEAKVYYTSASGWTASKQDECTQRATVKAVADLIKNANFGPKS
jgi:hypothetical protein